jgi:hypothetical protein
MRVHAMIHGLPENVEQIVTLYSSYVLAIIYTGLNCFNTYAKLSICGFALGKLILSLTTGEEVAARLYYI